MKHLWDVLIKSEDKANEETLLITTKGDEPEDALKKTRAFMGKPSRRSEIYGILKLEYQGTIDA